MRISDWSSDVCSSDLPRQDLREQEAEGCRADLRAARDGCAARGRQPHERAEGGADPGQDGSRQGQGGDTHAGPAAGAADRKSDGQGKRETVRFALGVRRTMTKKDKKTQLKGTQ